MHFSPTPTLVDYFAAVALLFCAGHSQPYLFDSHIEAQSAANSGTTSEAAKSIL